MTELETGCSGSVSCTRGSIPRITCMRPVGLFVGTHYCLAVGNDEGLELDETDEDEELGESNEE